MRYDLSKEIEVQKARIKFEYLINKKVRIDLTEKRKNRSLSQNNYLHVCLCAYAIAYGDSLEYVKQEVWKKKLCPEIFKTEIVNRVTGEVREGYKSSSDLNTKEMTQSIDRLRDSASKDLGCYIGSPDDLVWQDQINNLIEENKQYL